MHYLISIWAVVANIMAIKHETVCNNLALENGELSEVAWERVATHSR